jgi:hypothetical protein
MRSKERDGKYFHPFSYLDEGMLYSVRCNKNDKKAIHFVKKRQEAFL